MQFADKGLARNYTLKALAFETFTPWFVRISPCWLRESQFSKQLMSICASFRCRIGPIIVNVNDHLSIFYNRWYVVHRVIMGSWDRVCTGSSIRIKNGRPAGSKVFTPYFSLAMDRHRTVRWQCQSQICAHHRVLGDRKFRDSFQTIIQHEQSHGRHH